MSIYEKLLDFKSKVGAVKKDGNNPFHKSKYATIESVLDTIEKPLKECGLGFIQCPQQDGLKTIVFSNDSDFTIESFVPYIGATDMQKLGSAITYARRYALVSMFGLEQEDDDGNKASGYTQKPQAKPQQQVKVIAKINQEQVRQLESLFTSDEHKASFLAKCKIVKLEDMPLNWFGKALDSLK